MSSFLMEKPVTKTKSNVGLLTVGERERKREREQRGREGWGGTLNE